MGSTSVLLGSGECDRTRSLPTASPVRPLGPPGTVPEPTACPRGPLLATADGSWEHVALRRKKLLLDIFIPPRSLGTVGLDDFS